MAGDPPTYTGTSEAPALKLDPKTSIRTKPPGLDRFLNFLSLLIQIGILVTLIILAVKVQSLHRAFLGTEGGSSYIRRPLVNVGAVSRINTGTVWVTGVQTVSVQGTPVVRPVTR